MPPKRPSTEKTPKLFTCGRCPGKVFASDSERRSHQNYCKPEIKCVFADGTKKSIERDPESNLFTCPGQNCPTTSQLGDTVIKCAAHHNPPSVAPPVVDSLATPDPTPTAQTDATSDEELNPLEVSTDSTYVGLAKRTRMEQEEGSEGKTGEEQEQQEGHEQVNRTSSLIPPLFLVFIFNAPYGSITFFLMTMPPTQELPSVSSFLTSRSTPFIAPLSPRSTQTRRDSTSDNDEVSSFT